ncbi:MAG TPA: DUF3488 and transglutaminase-like domain-containing protein, partial [Opitutus sp.]|nr:DUF3488 and transglutaminase-like domain-containing protein [Opitutus sp.]
MRTGERSSQLSSDEMQQLKWLLGGFLTLLAVATVFYLDVDAWTMLGLTACGVVAGLARPSLVARVPRWVHRLAFPLVAAFFAGDLWLSGELLPAMVRLDMLLLLYRAMIYRQKRDDLQVIVLGLFLVVVAGVLSVSLAFALHILAFTAAALVFLLVITLAEASGAGAAGAGGDEQRTPAWAQHVRWRALLGRVREVTDWRVVALGGALFAGLVGLSVVLFLAIPRFQLEISFFLERFISKKSKSGFNETIRFGDVTEITTDTSVALSVDVSDRSRIPAAPYWRMLVLDEYRDGTFRLSAALRAKMFGGEQGRMNLQGSLRGRADAVAWTFYLEAGISRYLPLLGEFEQLRFRERQNYRAAPGLGLIALRDEPVTMTAYRVAGLDTSPVFRDGGFGRQFAERSSWTGTMLRLGLPEADRAVLDRIVGEIAGGRPVPASGETRAATAALSAEEFARRAEAWLSGRHSYSLQPRIPPGEGDPLVRWLNSDEAGHCELFAGSFVLLARAAGYPTRVVTGFRGGSWNGY